VNQAQFSNCRESPAGLENGSLDRFVPRDDRKTDISVVTNASK